MYWKSDFFRIGIEEKKKNPQVLAVKQMFNNFDPKTHTRN